MFVAAVIEAQAFQSSWSKGSSIDTIGKSLINSSYKACNFSGLNHLLLSELGFLKSKSYCPKLKQ